MSDDSYRVLMVCTGNICRSPVMERLLVARLQRDLPAADAARFVVTSAGTWAMDAAPMSPEAAETLVALGGDPTGFVSRDLAVETLAAADLILTAEVVHRRLAVQAEPAVADRAFTLRELARLLTGVTVAEIDQRAPGDDPVQRMRAIVAVAAERRSSAKAADPRADDIADPYGQSRVAYQRAADQIDAALAVPLALLITS